MEVISNTIQIQNYYELHVNFQEHVNRTEKKASRALQIIREVKGISKISTKKLINLYVTLVRSVMEYGCSVWQTVARPDLKKKQT